MLSVSSATEKVAFWKDRLIKKKENKKREKYFTGNYSTTLFLRNSSNTWDDQSAIKVLLPRV